jgi:poly(3-hydroxybutyrate) depolymerase
VASHPRKEATVKNAVRSTRRAAAALLAALTATGLIGGTAHAATPDTGPPATYALGDAYVVGVSSGGYMATQLHVANSGTFKGTGIFSAGPYHCAKGSVSTAQVACMYGLQGRDLPGLEQTTKDRSAEGSIDDVANLSGDPVYVYHGSNDRTVVRAVNDELVTYYTDFGANVQYDNTTAAGHAWVSPLGPGACETTASPYVNNCGNDPEGAMLGHLFGSVNAPNTGQPAGEVQSFDQNPFTPGGDAGAISMGPTGYRYVPSSCESNTCRLVVALHGCYQSAEHVGTTFVEKSYLNQYADTNNAIVLYPQAEPNDGLGNPRGCWDWWGYRGAGDYDTREGPQMSTIMRMVQGLGG